ncbi:hypothetical protein C8F04DRAFT_1273343 [Mycena alexandri]|uniref:Uncharacterized protein n=1 Tax=Mycena alexandri TaxID=1745969 RepID=A0AAD6S7B4_9AGAR|nr:hypothetical protein C8F04DRAFT_1273343 [Mycena alexandri]
MTGTTGNASTEVRSLSRAQRRLKRHQHKLAQRHYREKNKEALRVRARTQMQAYRARIQKSQDLKALARESRREADASYRERCGQKKWIARFGEGPFDDIYLPQFAIHGNNTHKLQFVRETEKLAEERLAKEAKEARRAKDHKHRES